MPRASALVLLFAIGLGLAIACADEPPAGDVSPDAGEPTLPVTAVCPDAAPEAGEGCAVPEGTTCAFGACGTPIASCTRGSWIYARNPPPSSSCPSPEPPPADTPCPPCWPAAALCDYGTCSGPDASTNTAVASCPAGRWALVVTPCGPGTPADAGADVQDAADPDAEPGDAEADGG